MAMFASETLHTITDGYHGVILLGSYSAALKKRVSEAISHFEALDALGTPAIPYISAWRADRSHIWHEYSGNRLHTLLGCKPEGVSQALRRCIVDRCIYRHPHFGPEVTKETLNTFQINRSRPEIRQEVVRDGLIDAVYKLAPGSGRVFWLKDQAKVESYPEDGICLSLGMLSVVTKEMQAEEALKRTKEALQNHRDQLEKIVAKRTGELRQTQLEIVCRLAKAAEFLYGTNPLKSDTDDDGYSDGWEKENGMNPTSYNANQTGEGGIRFGINQDNLPAGAAVGLGALGLFGYALVSTLRKRGAV